MYFLIQGWGSERREYAAMKFFIYTAAGSAFLLASTLVLAFLHQADTGVLTFDYRVLADWNGLSGTTERRAVPRLHGRVRDQGAAVPVPHLAAARAHRGADRGLGGAGRRDPEDGRLRLRCGSRSSCSRRPRSTSRRSCSMLAVIGIIYGAIVAAMQTDLKRVIAYSSVAHMGFVVLGIFSLTVIGLDGARVHDGEPPAHHRRAVPRGRHALRAPPHARDRRVPRHLEGRRRSSAALFLIALFAGIGLPGFSGFVGEFLSLLGRVRRATGRTRSSPRSA